MKLYEAINMFPDTVIFEKTGVIGDSRLRTYARQTYGRDTCLTLMQSCADVWKAIATDSYNGMKAELER